METALGRAVSVALSLAFTVSLVAAAENSAPHSFKTCSAQKQCRQLSRAELSRLRGGLSMGANSELQLTFGITKLVYVNNELVALTQVVLPAVNQGPGAGTPSASQLQTLNSTLPSGQATPPPPTTSKTNGPSAPAVLVNGVQVTPANPLVVNVPTADELRAMVIQNGAGNSVPNAAEFQAAKMATVIQNTQDNQTIRTVTMFNVSIDLSAARRAMEVGYAIRNSMK